jgi:molybdopterin converting factor small subunit
MNFVIDDVIRSAVGLDTSKDLSKTKVKDIELIKNIEALRNSFQKFSKEEYEEECIRRGFEDYFNLANIDTYFDLKCKVALPFTETTMKYIFMSYIYSAYALKKSRELVRRREEQVAVLFRFFRQLKQRLKKVEGEYRKKKTEMDVLTDLHTNCKVSQLLQRIYNCRPTALWRKTLRSWT